MKKKPNKVLNLMVVIISCGLILFWLVASVIFLGKGSITLLSIRTINQNSYRTPQIQVDNAHQLYGKFTSSDNDLGIVTIGLSPSKTPQKSKNKVVFEFKESGSKKWIMQGYDIGLFDSQNEFSFGVPVIRDSFYKNYEFKISISGDKSARIIIKNPNQLIAGYKFSKEELKSNKIILPEFVVRKIITNFSDSGFFIKSLIFLFPLLVFLILVWILKHARNLKKYIKPLFLIFLISLLVLPSSLKVDSTLILIVLWIVLIIWFKTKSKVSFIICAILILIWILIIPFKLVNLELKLNILVYATFAIGVVQLLIEESRRRV